MNRMSCIWNIAISLLAISLILQFTAFGDALPLGTPESAGFSENELHAFIRDQNIPFENAIVSNEIIKKYNVPDGMATFVVASDMRLVIKNLQGEVTVGAVTAAIDLSIVGYRGKMYE